MVTEAMLVAAIDAMPVEFDSHDVILEVAHNNQSAYVAHLHSENPSDTPFQNVHARLGSEIARICRSRNYVEEQGRSKDIFRQMSRCMFWKKVA